MNDYEKAVRAEEILNDPLFRDVIKSLKEEQSSTFLNPRSSEEARADAHLMVRALDRIESRLGSIVTNAKILRKRKERRSAPWISRLTRA